MRESSSGTYYDYDNVSINPGKKNPEGISGSISGDNRGENSKEVLGKVYLSIEFSKDYSKEFLLNASMKFLQKIPFHSNYKKIMRACSASDHFPSARNCHCEKCLDRPGIELVTLGLLIQPC